MRTESLRTVIRLRQEVVDEISLHLAACIGAESAATVAVREQAGEIDRQRQAAEAVGAGDIDVEAFGAWYPRARARLQELSASHDRSVTETTRARAQLTAARAALEAAETLLEEARLAAVAEALRLEQRQIDEAAGRYAGRHLAPRS